MTSPYEMFNTDKNLESGEGIKLDYGPFKFTLHRAGGSNKKYAQVLNAKIAPYRRQLQAGTLDDSISTKIMAEVYADSVIIGWDGVTDEKGKKLAYTRENVVKLLLELPELFGDIQIEAVRIANFRKEQIEADAKNSPKS